MTIALVTHLEKEVAQKLQLNTENMNATLSHDILDFTILKKPLSQRERLLLSRHSWLHLN